MRVLISRLSSLGDVVCTLPVASAIKSSYPDSEITWLVDKRFKAVVRSCSAVDRIEEARFTASRSSWPLLNEPFDIALDMQGLLKSALPIGFCRARRKLGYHWRREGAALFSRAVIPDPSSLQVVDQYVDVARAVGAQADRAEFNLVPQAEDLAHVRGKLEEDRLGSFVAINPGAGWSTKKWPVENWISLCSALQREGRKVVIIGGNSDTEIEASKAITEGAGGWPVSWVGSTTIGQLIATLSLCDAHIGGDTGSSHISAALGKPCVGLYSITNPKRSCPYGQIENCLYERRGLAHISPSAVLQTLLGVMPA